LLPNGRERDTKFPSAREPRVWSRLTFVNRRDKWIGEAGSSGTAQPVVVVVVVLVVAAATTAAASAAAAVVPDVESKPSEQVTGSRLENR